MRWFMRRVLATLGARTIVGIAVTLLVLDLLIPDPIPFLDEILLLVGTVLLSQWAKAQETIGDATPLKYAGRGKTQ